MSDLAPAALRGTGGHVRLEHVSKTYADTRALNDVSLDIQPGEFITLLGASGSGKTTLLNIVAGFTRASAGRVEVDGRDLTTVPSHQRNLGMVFQDYALFPHMSVFDNVAFPLRRRRFDKGTIRSSVDSALEVVELAGLAARRPDELSGGQQQRVALARAIVYQPPVLLMDEPLGALDKRLREQLQLEIRRLHRELGTTLIFVTHDQEEALAMSDRVALLRDGALVQVGTPESLYQAPSCVYAADFLGESNIFHGRVDGDVLRDETSGLTFTLPDNGRTGTAALVIRPEHLEVLPAGSSVPAGCNALDGVVREITYAGASRRYDVRSGAEHDLVARAAGSSQEVACSPGQAVTVFWHADNGVLIHEGAGDADVASVSAAR